MTAPDKIWASGFDARPSGRWWNEAEFTSGSLYIRADLVQHLIQAAHDLDRQFCDDDLGPSALAMCKLREAYTRLK